ncbi:MAG: hypothetical protein IPH76_08195 [Xanthomonadales bacterium]|nr:hypothetical protein [Xanthomonadales bacterium]
MVAIDLLATNMRGPSIQPLAIALRRLIDYAVAGAEVAHRRNGLQRALGIVAAAQRVVGWVQAKPSL